jgi:solute carrier family 25 carnitine/acylcarnitine transporter 20/29
MASGAARAIVECPLEVAKIRRQIGETWKFLGLYKGLGVNMARNIPLLSFFFIFLEISKNYDMPSNLRPFISGSICSTLAWTLIWPFDVIKSQIQGSTGNESLFQKIKIHYKNFGIFGFFRGYVPGAIRSLLANGLSMVALVKTQQYLENYFRLSK